MRSLQYSLYANDYNPIGKLLRITFEQKNGVGKL